MGIELAIAAAIAGAAAGTTFTVAAGLTLGFSWVAAAVSLGLGILQTVMAPKPNTNGLSTGTSIKSSGITQNIRQAITSRRTIYGECRVGGTITFIETTNDDKYLHMILVLCDHEIENIGEIWFDDISIPTDHIDVNGNVYQGTYSGKARIKKYLGTAAQTADADLIAETSVDSTFEGKGVAYIYARLEFDRDVYPGRIPVITAFVRGKKVYDPRDTVTRYSANAMMFVNDYLVTPVESLTPGVGVSQSAVDSAAFIAAANICEEMVTTAAITDTIWAAEPTIDTIAMDGLNSRLQYQTGDRVTVTGGSLPGGLVSGTDYYVIAHQRLGTPRCQLATTLANALAGTAVDITSDGTGSISKNAEPRYFGGGIVETTDAAKSTIENLLTASGGSATYIGGKWVFKAAAYSTPVFTFNESHMISSVVVRTKVSRRDRFNLVKGVYISPLNDGQTSDYPVVQNATYVTQDNGRKLPIDHDLPYTQRPHTAQRLAKIKLERHRQELFFECEYKLHAMQVQPGDTVYINNTRMGWTNKVFEVVSWSLGTRNVGNVPLFYVKMALQETASACFDWNNGEETVVDPAPNTTLPDPRVVNPPVGLFVTPREIRTAENDLTYEFDIGWTPPDDIFVVNGGYYEVEFKKTTEPEFRTSYNAKDTDTAITVKQVEPGVTYDARMRSINQMGVRSIWQSLFGFSIDSPSGATIRMDWGRVTEAIYEFNDWGLVSDPTTDGADWGEVV